MANVAFADESGTTGSTKCYAIGVVSVAKRNLDAFNSVFDQLKKVHGVDHEAHWTGVRTSHGLINFTIDWLSRILRSRTARFDVIVVHTELYRNWSRRGADREQAFYKTYTYLLRHVARQVRVTSEVFIDGRSDGYAKQHEAIQTIANRMLDQLHATGRLERVTKVRSHDHPGIQVADLLTGAVATSHRLFLDSKAPVHPGKLMAIERMAALLGWDALHYDTYPHNKFNIWHFPGEYRACPETRRIRASRMTPFVTPDDLARALKRPLLHSA